MGIKGLLPHLRSIEEIKKLDSYKDLTLAVDGYSWLHKAVYGCGEEIVIKNDYTRFLKSFLARVVVLKNLNIKVVMVFDGDKLPSKDNTEELRAEKRKRYREEADMLYRQGRIVDAAKKYECSIDITPNMAKKTLDFVRSKYDIECIVAPYEADAQLAYLAQIGYVDGILTEDSDLIVFNGKRILFKLDNQHNLREIKTKNLKNVRPLNFSRWGHDKFIECCILSGCDYLKSPKGIAFKTAHSLFTKHETLDKVFEKLKKKKNPINQDYIDNFEKAFLTFKYQTVWDPVKKKLVSMSSLFGNDDLNMKEIEKIDIRNLEGKESQIQIRDKNWLEKYYIAPEEEGEDDLIYEPSLENGLGFLGPRLDPKLAEKICNCEINPETKTEFEDLDFYYSKSSLTFSEIRDLAYLKSELPFKYRNGSYKSQMDSLSTKASRQVTIEDLKTKTQPQNQTKKYSEIEDRKSKIKQLMSMKQNIVQTTGASFELNKFSSQSRVKLKAPLNLRGNPQKIVLPSIKVKNNMLKQSKLKFGNIGKFGNKDVKVEAVSFKKKGNQDFEDIDSEEEECEKDSTKETKMLEEETPTKEEIDLSRTRLNGDIIDQDNIYNYQSTLTTSKAKRAYKDIFAKYKKEARKSSIKAVTNAFRTSYLNRLNQLNKKTENN